MKIGIIGTGQVGQTLAVGFKTHGHQVSIGTRSPEKLADYSKGAGQGISVTSALEAVKGADVVVLAVKGAAALEAIAPLAASLKGKVVIDTTNPIAEAPPEQGVLRFFTDLNESLLEKLQAANPEVRFVKAFSCVGSALMVDPKLPGGKPSMFIAGNDAQAKATVSQLLEQFGWETEDMGAAAAARAIEPLCMLWCIPGFLKNDWMHAFKVLRP
ncbi:MAG: NAD(P)-binding domain-containing protein [Polyangiaceae bacterium]|nr:NAD(P)-binding domain-containing protein [Polyangiaceae bacterium]